MILALRQVAKVFGSVIALDGVDLEVAAGERLALIGPNGSGKTTLFNVTSGYFRASSGRVMFQGVDHTSRSMEQNARAGMVRTFQHDAVFPGQTVAENIDLPLRMRHSRDNVDLPADLEALLDIADLTGTANTPAAILSYGNRRRLGIALAVALNPVLLLLDEPAAGLNESETHALLLMLRTLGDLGLTMVVIEHDMPFISALCGRAVVLDAGKVIATGTPQEVRANPAVIEAYLGDSVAHAD